MRPSLLLLLAAATAAALAAPTAAIQFSDVQLLTAEPVDTHPTAVGSPISITRAPDSDVDAIAERAESDDDENAEEDGGEEEEGEADEEEGADEEEEEEEEGVDEGEEVVGDEEEEGEEEAIDVGDDADGDDDGDDDAKFTLEAARALAKPADGVTVWNVSDAEAKQAVAGGYATGNWSALNASAYRITACAPQNWTVSKTKVTSLQLRFSAIAAAGDQVVVSALNGSHPQVFDDAPDGVTTEPIAGKALLVAFRPAADGKSGCAVSGVLPTMTLEAVGFKWSKQMLVTKEAICGAKDTTKNAMCANQNGNAAMYAKSRAVVRTERTRGDGALVTCTAWLWGNKGHIVTNYHCFPNQESVDKARFQFMVETPGCDGSCYPGSCPVAQVLEGLGNVKFLKTNANLDYSVLQITNNPQEFVNKYGYLKIRFAAPTKGEAIYIPQHPYGGPKKIAMTDDDGDRVAATVKDTNYAITVNGKQFLNLVGYAADTAGGSSGAPVIAVRDHLVVGLHRIGDCNNAATASNFLAGPLKGVAMDNDGFGR
ncbi:hypothetical protein PybrP1_001051 [[Pythium] brassicae (nom. inval.)]|nr:hypothetical protein PybrP1_001051 [[Pythium] brassicae (nom. inval.)]